MTSHEPTTEHRQTHTDDTTGKVAPHSFRSYRPFPFQRPLDGPHQFLDYLGVPLTWMVGRPAHPAEPARRRRQDQFSAGATAETRTRRAVEGICRTAQAILIDDGAARLRRDESDRSISPLAALSLRLSFFALQ